MNANSELRRRLVGVVVLCAVVASVAASQQTFTYDPAGRLIGVDYGANRTVSLAYDNAGNLLHGSQPSPDVLVSSIVGNQLTLSWPAAPAGFTLETAPSLDPGAIWTNANLATTLNGNLFTATIPVGGATKFYRLRSS